MATIEEFQEIQRRGVQDQLPESSRAVFEELTRRGLLNGSTSEATQPGQETPAVTEKPPRETTGFDDSLNFAAGIGQGLQQLMQGFQQFGKEGAQLEEFNKKVLQDRLKFEESQAGRSTRGKIGRLIGETGPTLFVPGGAVGSIGRRIATGGLSGAAIGGTQFTEGDKGFEAGVGAAIGSTIPGIFSGGKALVDAAVPFLGKVTSNLLKKVGGDELLRSTLKRVEAGKRLGLDLTPAEASGSGQLAEIQGRAGISPKGGKILERAGKTRQEQGEASIRKFLFGISPEGSSANEAVRTTAKKIVGDEVHAMQKAAKPFYEKARTDLVPEAELKNLMTDPVIKKGYDDIFKDVAALKESKDAPLNSIQMLHLAKVKIDREINKEVTSRAPDAFRIKVMTESKNDLLNVADTFSPDYQKGRAIYEEGSPAIEKLQGSPIGRIANLSDDRIKNVSQVLFDTAQTDPKVIRKMARRFSEEDPEAWRRVIRNEMERRLDQVGADRTTSTFFNQILKKDRDFKLFFSATEGMPGTRKALVDMRRAFKDLIPPERGVKASAFRASQSLDQKRNFIDAAKSEITALGINRRDKAIAEIITNPRWHEELAIAVKKGQEVERVPRIAALIGKVAAQQGTGE